MGAGAERRAVPAPAPARPRRAVLCRERRLTLWTGFTRSGPVSAAVTGGKLIDMRETEDDHRDDEQSPAQPAAPETRAQAAAIARMLANPRRVRRA